MPSRPDPSKGEKHASCQWRRSRRPRPDRSGRGICVHPHRRTSQPYPPDPGKEPGPPGGHAARTGGHLHGRRLRPHDGQARRGHAHRRTGLHQLHFALGSRRPPIARRCWSSPEPQARTTGTRWTFRTPPRRPLPRLSSRPPMSAPRPSGWPNTWKRPFA